VLHGQRRYLLAHPDQCEHLELFPLEHPSGRHTSVNWSIFGSTNSSTPCGGPFGKALLNEVVLQGGDALYLPTSWFHAIVNLSTNAQCNARSGKANEHRQVLAKCGFPVG
jgi:uncharacterized RmlC-like cupin family protein